MAVDPIDPMQDTEAELKEHQRVMAIRRLEEAHDALDFLYIPRKDHGYIFTVAGRVNWLRNYFPVEFSALADKVEKWRKENEWQEGREGQDAAPNQTEP